MSWSGSFSQNYVDPQHLIEAEQQIEVFMGMFQRQDYIYIYIVGTLY